MVNLWKRSMSWTPTCGAEQDCFQDLLTFNTFAACKMDHAAVSVICRASNSRAML